MAKIVWRNAFVRTVPNVARQMADVFVWQDSMGIGVNIGVRQ